MVAILCTPYICNHVHDERCGYNPLTNEGCTHQCIEVDCLDEHIPPLGH